MESSETESPVLPQTETSEIETKIPTATNIPDLTKKSLSINGEDKEKRAPEELPKSPRDFSGFRWFLIVACILCNNFLFALDNTVVADVQPAVVGTLGQIDKLPWVVVGFGVASTSVNLMYGRLYSVINAKWLYMGSLLVFEIGSAVCGSAQTMDAFIVGRVLCGLGGIGQYVGVLSIVSLLTTEQERPTYFGLCSMTWGFGTIVGPLVGGGFQSSPNATWRWGFYINLVLAAVVVPILVAFIPSVSVVKGKGLSWKQRLSGLDYLGQLLFTGVMISGVMAITFGGTQYTWNSGEIIGLFCCSGALILVLVIQQALAFLTSREAQLFPVKFLQSRLILSLFVLTSTAVCGTMVPIFLLPLYFQFILGSSALSAGVKLLPMVIFLIFFSVAGGITMGITGWYKPMYILGTAMVLTGSVLLSTITIDTTMAGVYGYSILTSSGVGIYMAIGYTVVQVKVEKHLAAAVAAFVSFSQAISAVISVSIADAVFFNRTIIGIEKLIPGYSNTELEALLAGNDSTLFNTLSPEMKQKVLDAIVYGISRTFYLPVAAGALGLLLSLTLSNERLQMKKN